jgi:hypothetical protein
MLLSTCLFDMYYCPPHRYCRSLPLSLSLSLPLKG